MKSIIEKLIKEILKEQDYGLVPFSVDVPPKGQFGDFATNAALLIASKKNENPRDVAERISNSLKAKDEIENVEVAGPGFLNIFIKKSLFFDELFRILKEKEDYGKSNFGKGKKLQVEFISANPTGPLHVGNARGGPIGESLANLHEFLGYEVEREFYINDMGGQIKRFAESLYYWYAKKIDEGIEFPEGGYPGDYIKKISESIQTEKKKELEELKDKEEILELFKTEGLYYTVKSIREDSELIGIKFDKWVNQSDFQHSGKSDQVINQLIEAGATVKKEGALWFKNPNDPEMKDKESVLKKSDEVGTSTYFADDIAYHVDKFERGFDTVIDVWGANHHGHVPRMKAAISVLGYSEDRLQIVLYQYVRLKNAGEILSMAKRLGNFVTLQQVIESGVDPDAFKYFILAQNPNTPFDFDLKLAADNSEKNPVFYIKYAHARISSILEKAGVGKSGLDLDDVDFKLLENEKETSLYKELVNFPGLLKEVSENFQIQSIPHYAYKVAALFHDFYTNCQVLGTEEKLSKARLALVQATKYVLLNALYVCDIEAPEKM